VLPGGDVGVETGKSLTASGDVVQGAQQGIHVFSRCHAGVMDIDGLQGSIANLLQAIDSALHSGQVPSK
jgi:hypothetical protein